MARTFIFLTATGAGQWTVPSNWNPYDNSIGTLGGAGSGARAVNSYGGGGGGGAYSQVDNVNLTPGTLID